MVGDPESKRLKVAALNLFRPTAFLLFRKAVFSYYDTVSHRGGALGEGSLGSVIDKTELMEKRDE